jgi:polyphenol oxidase
VACKVQPQIVSSGRLAWIEHPLLARYRWLIHAFSTRRGGASRGALAGLNLGFPKAGSHATVRKNRDLFFRQLGVENFAQAALRQVHTATIYQVGRASGGELEYRLGGNLLPRASADGQPEGDALSTDEAGIILEVRTADCLPVLLVDPKRRAVAAVHAGWRGALARIVEKAVGEMRRLYGSNPRNMLAVLGPSIRVCCYEVGQEVEDSFHGGFLEAEGFFRRGLDSSRFQLEGTGKSACVASFLNMLPPGHNPSARPSAHLDLVAVAQAQLRDAGLEPDHVATTDFCTACRPDLFYSHRREGGSAGRMLAVIGIRGSDSV